MGGTAPSGELLGAGLQLRACPQVGEQSEGRASAQTLGFHFYLLMGQVPVQLAEAMTLTPSFCQLSLFGIFLP